MEKIKVKNAIISRQGKESDNFEKFLSLSNQKKVNVLMVQAGEKIQVDKDCLITIIFPEKELISTNILNNNSIVAKFSYNIASKEKFSILLTGDIEEIAEKRLIEKYQLNNVNDVSKLKTNILKVAHHRI